MDDFLKSAKQKEKELVIQLESSPLFRQLESLRQTIAEFENVPSAKSNGIANGKTVSSPDLFADGYKPQEFTWKDRIRFVIRKYGSAGQAELVKEIQRLEPDKYGKDFIYKRVGVTLLSLKNDEEIDVKRVGKKNKYFIKQKSS